MYSDPCISQFSAAWSKGTECSAHIGPKDVAGFEQSTRQVCSASDLHAHSGDDHRHSCMDLIMHKMRYRSSRQAVCVNLSTPSWVLLSASQWLWQGGGGGGAKGQVQVFKQGASASCHNTKHAWDLYPMGNATGCSAEAVPKDWASWHWLRGGRHREAEVLTVPIAL